MDRTGRAGLLRGPAARSGGTLLLGRALRRGGPRQSAGAAVIADATAVYEGAQRVRRHLVFLRPCVVLLFDEVESIRPEEVWLNFTVLEGFKYGCYELGLIKYNEGDTEEGLNLMQGACDEEYQKACDKIEELKK